MKKDKKAKKSKPLYYDDGRTIADMSSLNGGKRRLGGNATPSLGGRASLKEQAQTYFAAVKMMIAPMLTVIGAICVLFLLMYIILELAS